ncbi:hypothetical protein TPE_1606 [Treponema pedis str. T A4]|uniref:Uncharacterized protein n=4 Tax=Treponemataceae TaxID=2845253 RepID=S5ZNF3_9SPIR|nr:hypothetical protein TPE_1606 [Treponema pedis str. T A4]
MSKKNYFLLLIFAFAKIIIAEDLTMFSVNLEYDVPNEQNILFGETCSLALDIVEIKADDISIDSFEDVRDITFIDVSYQKSFEAKAKIKMYWYLIGDYYIYNDGRGILFIENKNGFYQPYTNSFRIPATTKLLEIRYRVLLPDVEKNNENLKISLPENGNYTKVYSYKVLINTLFED